MFERSAEPAAVGPSTSTPLRSVTSAPAASTPPPTVSPRPPHPAPRWQHVVVLVLENSDATSIIGNPQAPYLNEFARSGINLTDMHAETHPSQPNYVALLSGSTQGLTDDSCPHTFAADNLARNCAPPAYSFVGYSESLPQAGYTGLRRVPVRAAPRALDRLLGPAGRGQPTAVRDAERLQRAAHGCVRRP